MYMSAIGKMELSHTAQFGGIILAARASDGFIDAAQICKLGNGKLMNDWENLEGTKTYRRAFAKNMINELFDEENRLFLIKLETSLSKDRNIGKSLVQNEGEIRSDRSRSTHHGEEDGKSVSTMAQAASARAPSSEDDKEMRTCAISGNEIVIGGRIYSIDLVISRIYNITIEMERHGCKGTSWWVYPRLAINIMMWVSSEYADQVCKWIFTLHTKGTVTATQRENQLLLERIREEHEVHLAERDTHVEDLTKRLIESGEVAIETARNLSIANARLENVLPRTVPHVQEEIRESIGVFILPNGSYDVIHRQARTYKSARKGEEVKKGGDCVFECHNVAPGLKAVAEFRDKRIERDMRATVQPDGFFMKNMNVILSGNFTQDQMIAVLTKAIRDVETL